MNSSDTYNEKAKVKVLIVDDSALIRQLLTEIISSDPDLEVVGTASDPLKARELIRKTNPDVVTLDVEMPKMNGIDFLEKIMKLRPMPVVMISSLTSANANTTLKALELGALDFVLKPNLDLKKSMANISEEIIQKVKNAANSNVHVQPVVSVKKTKLYKDVESSVKLVAIGASTGGVEAIRYILSCLPANFPPILIVQHMPKLFTTTFANRLNDVSELNIHEAQDGQLIEKGNVYIAPGDFHLEVADHNDQLYCHVYSSKPVKGHMPSADVLFNSVAKYIGQKSVGLILSGMGKDGAEGLLSMRSHHAMTMGQAMESCVVYGMPRVANELGAVVREHQLDNIPEHLLSEVGLVHE